MRTSNKFPNHIRVDHKLKHETAWFNLKDIIIPDFNYLPNDLIRDLSNQPSLVNQGVMECIKSRHKKTVIEITNQSVQYCKTKRGISHAGI